MIVQRTDYYASGEPWLEPVYGSGAADNRYLFGGKERMAGGALNEYDFEARNYVASFQRFTTIDPEAEKFPWMSPYAYCNANPINFIDPTGRYTKVVEQSDGTYKVIGGKLDDDLNIYVYKMNEEGEYITTGESIGETTSATSFYYSEKNMWAEDATIDLTDESGVNFLDKIVNHTPSLPEYMDKARNDHPYDFKVTNGTDHVISTKIDYKYRGMQIGVSENGKKLITSARDIGNMAAGYVAGSHGLPWGIARLGFDGYQTISKGELNLEGISTVNAELYGWKIGFYGTSPIRKILNYEKTKASLFYKSVFWGMKFSINQILH